MSLILVHSPKGGVGSTFLAAQLALHLAQRGHDVSAIDFTYQDSLKLHFGLMPTQPLPDLAVDQGEALVVFGVNLANGHAAARGARFREGLAEGKGMPFDDDAVTIADVSADDRELRDLLLPYATVHVCALTPTSASLAVLPKVAGDAPAMKLSRTVFVLNQLDDRQRLSRHSHSFVRDLFGDQLIATVRRDEAVNEALAMFQPIAKFAPSSAVLPDLLRFTLAVEDRIGLAAPEPRMASAGGR